MNVYDVAVTFGRTVQPKEYESAKAEVTFKVAVDEGEDHIEVTDIVMREAKEKVLAALGLGPKAGADENPKATRKPRQTKAQKEAAEKEQAEVDAIEAEQSGGKSDTPSDDGLPGETAADDGGIPGEQGQGEIGEKQISNIARDGAKKHGGKKVRELMTKKYKAMRLGDLTQEERVEFKKLLEADKLEIPAGD